MSNWWEQDKPASGGNNWWDKDPTNRPRTYAEELLRQTGLGARYLAEGAAGTVAPFANAAGAAWNMTAGNLGAPRAGTDLVGAVSGVLDRTGLPAPQTTAENIAAAGSRAVAPGAAWSRAAAMAPAAVQAAAPAIHMMAVRPATETVASMAGAAAPEAVKQAGGGTIPQIVAGVLAGPVAQGAMGAGGMAARGVREIGRPVTKSGQEQIAADILGRIAADKNTAGQNLQRYLTAKELELSGGPVVGVPGSRPTSGAVSADYGIIGAEQAIARGDAAPKFALQQAQNNAARIEHLAKLNATKEQLAEFIKRRDAVTGPLRENAFKNATDFVDYAPVAEKLGEISASAAGGRAESRKALAWVAKQLETYAQEGRLDSANAYALYKDIGDLVAGKVKDSNGSALRLAGGLANEVKRVLGQQISAVSPGFSKYLETYARMSRPIDRLEKITETLGGRELAKVTNAGVASAGGEAQHVLSQAKMKNAVQGLRNDPDIRLAPRQSSILESVLGDLNAEVLASRGGRPPGSDTYQNMASANFLSRVLGDTLSKAGAVQPVSKALSFGYRPFGAESRIQDLIVQAYQDPELMRRLLAASRTARDSPTLVGTTPAITGGLLGYLSH